MRYMNISIKLKKAWLNSKKLEKDQKNENSSLNLNLTKFFFKFWVITQNLNSTRLENSSWKLALAYIAANQLKNVILFSRGKWELSINPNVGTVSPTTTATTTTTSTILIFRRSEYVRDRTGVALFLLQSWMNDWVKLKLF